MHGIAEPAGLTHWRKAAVEALRGSRLGPEPRFSLEVLCKTSGEHARG